MTPTPTVCTLTVAIERYVDRTYRQDTRRLRYAVADGRNFHAYAAAVWPAPRGEHVLLEDGAATVAAIQQVSEEFAERKPDLLIVYLSGHGEANTPARGWFCAVDAQPGVPSLDASELDRALERVGATSTLLFIDCCYAEAVVTGAKIFSGLAGKQARLFVASARADQRSWEDDELGQGVFSRFLLKALSPDSPCARDPLRVRVEAELLPYLGEQVALHVFERKGGQLQEPVKGGVAVGSVVLPLSNAPVAVSERSVFETIWRDRRRIAVGFAAVLLVSFVLVQAVLYHFSIVPGDRLQVRHGLRTFSLPSKLIPPRVEIALSPSEIEPSSLEPLQDGRLWGLWSPSDSHGLRGWWKKLSPLLREQAQLEGDLLLFGVLPSEFIRRKEILAEAWNLQLLADALGSGGDSSGALASRFEGALPGPAVLNCETHDADPFGLAAQGVLTLDYTVSLLPTGEFTGLLGALETYVSQLPAAAPAALDRAIGLAVLRLSPHRTSVPSQDAELGAYLRFLQAVPKATAGERISTLAGNVSRHNRDCRPFELAAIAIVGAPTERAMAQLELAHLADHGSRRVGSNSADDAVALIALAEITASLESGPAVPSLIPQLAELAARYKPEDDGDLPPPISQEALVALAAAAKHHRLDDDIIIRILSPVLADPRGAAGLPALVDWAAQVAVLQKLPDQVSAFFRSEVTAHRDEEDFHQLRALSVLARQAMFLTQTDRSTVWAVAMEGMPRHRGFADFDEAVGWFGCSGLTSPEVVSYLASRLNLEQPTLASSTSTQGYDLVTASDEAAGLALARIASRQAVPREIALLLERFASARIEIPGIEMVYAAIAEQRERIAANGPSRLTERITARLGETHRSARLREAEVGVAVAQVLRLDPQDRRASLDELRRLRDRETEPEIRLAFGDILRRIARRGLAGTNACSVLHWSTHQFSGGNAGGPVSASTK